MYLERIIQNCKCIWKKIIQNREVYIYSLSIEIIYTYQKIFKNLLTEKSMIVMLLFSLFKLKILF